ncbi:MAG: PilZ domain-containing protein [Calditrichia bacterium]|jgi:Tfp pilus assembly protein PilZ|nr:PilZ domain-containing protein [Calditrichia bacterium]
MTKERDRRYSDRFHFDEAKVYCQENSTFRFFKQFSEPFDLNDLTKSGISFKTNKKVSRGDSVHLKIDIPGRQKIHVKGRVVWVSNQETSDHSVGVQFLPFGTMKGYNTFNAREKLERLIGDTQHPEEEIQ